MPPQEMQFQGGPFKMRGWLWKGNDKGILVLHECYGIDDTRRSEASPVQEKSNETSLSNVMSACEKLNALGYTVFTFDIFGKDGPHPKAWGSERWTLERMVRPAYVDELIHKRIEGALDILKQNGATKLATLGFGILGGTFASLYPCKFNGQIAAAVSVCGPVVREPGDWKYQPLTECRTIDCPVFFIFAKKDPWVPERDFALIEKNLQDSKKVYKLKVYEDTESGFSSGFYNPKSPHYKKDLAEDCWSQVKDFLQQNMQ